MLENNQLEGVSPCPSTFREICEEVQEPSVEVLEEVKRFKLI